MKLYQFTYTDNQNLTDAELSARVAKLLNSECELQGWASDYRFQQSTPPVTLKTGEKQYYFEVIGSYASSESTSFDEEVKEAASSGEPPVAAQEANI